MKKINFILILIFLAFTAFGAPVDTVKKVQDAVVNITTTVGSAPASGAYDPYSKFKDMALEGLGAGFVVRSDGIIVTCYHVIERASSAKVSFSDGAVYDAFPIGWDKSLDIAVLKINPQRPLQTVSFGNSDFIASGETAIIIGNPTGFENSVLIGNIAHPKRYFHTNKGFGAYIQLAALMNHGNSGGPVFNEDGEVIGMAASSYTMDNAVGIGLAIPSNVLRRVVPYLSANQSLKKGNPGFTLRDDMTISGVATEGSAIGLKVGDKLISMDGIRMADPLAYDYILRTLPAGSETSAVFRRAGSELKVVLKVR